MIVRESFICSDCKVYLNRDDKSTMQIPTPTCGCGKPMSRVRVALSTPEVIGAIAPPVELPVGTEGQVTAHCEFCPGTDKPHGPFSAVPSPPKDDTRPGDVGDPGDPRCKRCGNRSLEEAIHGRARCWKCGLVQAVPVEAKP